MATKEHKKKRKSVGGSSGEVTVSLAEASTGTGPAFVNFPSVKPNKRTPFTVYSRDPGSSQELSKQQTLIAGETEDVEYFSTNRDRQTGEGADCSYVAALYDPETNSVTVAPAPLYLLAHRVKRMRFESTEATPTNALWKAKRNDLGETFGTRKAKSQIRAEERNKVDISAMASVRGSLINSIDGLETSDAPAGPSEFIPTPNLETTKASEVYPLDSIIPRVEWSAIDIKTIAQTRDDRARTQLLPNGGRSRWIENKMRVALDMKSTDRVYNLRMLYYLSCLLSLYHFSGRLSKFPSSDLPKHFVGVPMPVLQGLCLRFAEPTGKSRFTVTETKMTRLKAWIATCFLACDGWSVDVGMVSTELKLPAAKVTDLFKSLGCSVDLLSPAEREKMGISAAEASKNRRAVLKAPVKYPKVKKRAGPKR